MTTQFTELRAEEVQELLTRPPKWLLRWGITVVFAVLTLVFAGSWVVHYPDLLKASFVLTATNAPKALLTHTDGKLTRLFVREGQAVRTGEVLAYLESTASHADVLRLSGQLARAWPVANSGNLEAIDRLNLTHYHRLGELQNAYQTFAQAHSQLRAYLAGGFYPKKRAILQQELADLQALSQNLGQQQMLHEQDQRLAEQDYAIQQQLADQKVIAPLDLKREESKAISRKLPAQQIASALISNQTAQRAKQKELLELDKQVTEQHDTFLQALNTLQSAADAWKTKYVVVAPVAGRVYFSSMLQENQPVALNQELFSVAPPTADYYGELRIPQQNAGKVAIGQAVLIKLAGYPYQEYGAIRGQITAIAQIPLKDSVFLARVQLPSGLKTSYGNTLAYKTGMTATADIITTDSRLLEKLFYQLRKVLNGR